MEVSYNAVRSKTLAGVLFITTCYKNDISIFVNRESVKDDIVIDILSELFPFKFITSKQEIQGPFILLNLSNYQDKNSLNDTLNDFLELGALYFATHFTPNIDTQFYDGELHYIPWDYKNYLLISNFSSLKVWKEDFSASQIDNQKYETGIWEKFIAFIKEYNRDKYTVDSLFSYMNSVGEVKYMKYSTPENLLEQEYSKFLANKKAGDYLSSALRSKTSYKNAMENYLLSPSRNSFFDVVSKYDLKENVGSLYEKIKKTLDNPEKIVGEHPLLEVSTKNNITYFKYGKFSGSLENQIVVKLRENAIKRGYNDADKMIALMLMRYIGRYAYFRQFSSNEKLYKGFYDEGYTVEGFSSPFNSVLMMVADGDYEFCSLYYDVDYPFGSIGSVYDADFEGKGVILFPPMINKIVMSAIDLVLERLDDYKCKFILILPIWEDAAFLSKLDELESSPYFVQNYILDSSQYPTHNTQDGTYHKDKKFYLYKMERSFD